MLRLDVLRGAYDAETSHRVGGWVRTLPRILPCKACASTPDELAEFEACGPCDQCEVVACPLDWRNDARATPAGSIAAAEFVLRRIVQLRRDGYYAEARELRELLPDRDAWREWTGTHAIPDTHVRHNALAYRASELLDYAVWEGVAM